MLQISTILSSPMIQPKISNNPPPLNSKKEKKGKLNPS